jgi:hypothetical protein
LELVIDELCSLVSDDSSITSALPKAITMHSASASTAASTTDISSILEKFTVNCDGTLKSTRAHSPVNAPSSLLHIPSQSLLNLAGKAGSRKSNLLTPSTSHGNITGMLKSSTNSNNSSHSDLTMFNLTSDNAYSQTSRYHNMLAESNLNNNPSVTHAQEFVRDLRVSSAYSYS